MENVALIIPFRDRGHDPLRAANLEAVLSYWKGYGSEVHVVSDGGSGDDQFNRSAAYNAGAELTDAEVLVYTESDMLLDYDQIDAAVDRALRRPGLVVPFTSYRYLSPEDSAAVRGYEKFPEECVPESTMENGRSIGAVNVVSRETLARVGQWDTCFSGSWYDDNAMHRAFELTCGLTRWIEGAAYHLYHLPGWKGDHLSDEDRAATERNRQRFELYRSATTPERIRELTSGSLV